jgi:YidC/Oxa1 family membrane protein insertase
MEKQALIAIILSLLVLLAFKYYQEHRTAQISNSRQPPQTAVLPSMPITLLPEASIKGRAFSPQDTKAAAKKIFINGPLYYATLDNRGALLTSWKLKQYNSAHGDAYEMIDAENDGAVYPGSLLFQNSALSDLANSENYEVQVIDASNPFGALTPPATIRMKFKRGDFLIEKIYRFYRDNYLVDLSVTGQQGGKPLAGRMLLAQDIGTEEEHVSGGAAQLEAVFYRDGKVRRESSPNKENEIKISEGDVRWAGLDIRYFAVIAIPDRPFPSFDFQKRSVKVRDSEGHEVVRNLLRIAVPQPGSAQLKLYLGPKKRSDLEAVKAVDLTGVINYGMFSFLVLPLLSSLQWINQYIGNYGFSIVVLTFFLNILLFPLRLAQMISMKKMSLVQPKIKAIQEKYRQYKKTDSRRLEMNRELTELYRKHNVNPVGGCLPMVLQAPLLFAFYALLAYSIELRRAPFIGWIRDLSVKDTFYILPILMGITTFVSQKMAPLAPGTDPAHVKMMMVLPIVLTVMFLYYSAGLNLYFLSSNLFQIGFQKIGERWVGSRKTVLET